MAVLSVEVFARTNDAELLSPIQQYDLHQRFSDALQPLHDPSAFDTTLVLDAQITPHDSGAYIAALCMADAGTTASEAIANRLIDALTDFPNGQQWQLHAGVTLVLISNN